MESMDFSCRPAGARPPEGALPPGCRPRVISPIAPQNLLQRQACDSRKPVAGGPPDPLSTAVCHRLIRPASSTISMAALRQLTGPTLAERHARLAQLDQRMLAVTYGEERVTDCELLDHMACRHVPFGEHPDRMQLSDQALVAHLCGKGASLARPLLCSLASVASERLVAEPAVAQLAFRHCPWFFYDMPEPMKNSQRLAPVLARLPCDARRELLGQISSCSPDLVAELETIEEGIRRAPEFSCRRRANELDPGLRRLAVETHFVTLVYFSSLAEPEYGELCDLALQQSGEALAWIRPEAKTEARVDLALAHRQPADLKDIPAKLWSRDRLRAALSVERPYRFPRAFLDHWDLWDSMTVHPLWLRYLPDHERSEALCRQYLDRFPFGVKAVPAPILAQHPEWVERAKASDVCRIIELHERAASCYGPEADAGTAMNGQAWAQALAGWKQHVKGLPEACRQAILHNGGSGGLAGVLQPPPFFMEPETLLDWVQGAHCSRRVALFPDQARKALLCSPAFQLPRASDGQRLIGQIDSHIDALAAQILGGSLPVWQPTCAAGDWMVRGGRTLVREEGGRCVHMKFQREGEELAEFGAEEAVQRFALVHKTRLGLRSEIPQPEAVVFVPREHVPPAAGECTDSLKIHQYQGRPGYLAFRFTTRDNSYDTQAFEADDAQGGDSRARDGLLRALHDLGVWSSMGALHTSTLRLYHEFRDDLARPGLLLTGLFRSDAGYPGKLQLWNTRATDGSDWGWSGLRDLGDLEFYPCIRSYVEASDAGWTVPDYGQRASFVNGIAQNILASLLHIMRLYRATDPDYHYQNPQVVTRLGQFMEEGCNALLTGLLGDGTRLQDFFPEQTADGMPVYSQWRERAATEMIYWTARQTPGADCFARHFQDHGCPSVQLYPGHPKQELLYPKNFTKDGEENLGADNNKLPLFFLVRGLYLLAIGLADRLGYQAGAAADGVYGDPGA